MQDEPGKIYLDPFRKENICLLLTYMSSGFVVYFTVTPVMYYLIHDSNASSTQVSVLIAIRVLPWSFKVVFGLLSDSAPILGKQWLIWSLIDKVSRQSYSHMLLHSN